MFATYSSFRGRTAFVSGWRVRPWGGVWGDRIAVNVRHHFFAAQAVARMMRDSGGGSIINLGSISAHIDVMDLPGYITAKAGIKGLTRTLPESTGHGTSG